MKLRTLHHSNVPFARALGVARSLAARAGPDPALYTASLTGKALALGFWQRSEYAIALETAASEGWPVLRRITGGPTAYAGQGVLYAALRLPHPSALMDTPRDRILNRNVRGFLTGLQRAGIGAHYFGREWISAERVPAALVGWDLESGGPTLLECFIGVSRSFLPPESLNAYPPRIAPAFLGKPVRALEEIQGASMDASFLARALAEGHAARYQVELDALAEPDPQGTEVDSQAQEDEGLRWSSLREIPIGFLAAGVRRTGNGVVDEVRLAGDFYQERGAAEALTARVAGTMPMQTAWVEAINATYGPGQRVLEGVRTLQPVLEAILEAWGSP